VGFATVNILRNPSRTHIAKKFATLQSKSISQVQAVVESAKFTASVKPTSTTGLKKTDTVWISSKTDFNNFELDEIFWFTGERRSHENGVNTYVMTMISRVPRQIVAFAVDKSKSADVLQRIVDAVPPANVYHTDGYYGYAGVDFCGRHNQNWVNKNDTHLIESTNADLRHYIPGLRRRSRIFYRSLETFHSVLSVFIDAYNKFGDAKINLKKQRRELAFSVLDFL